jgi:hypothetical protein
MGKSTRLVRKGTMALRFKPTKTVASSLCPAGAQAGQSIMTSLNLG